MGPTPRILEMIRAFLAAAGAVWRGKKRSWHSLTCYEGGGAFLAAAGAAFIAKDYILDFLTC